MGFFKNLLGKAVIKSILPGKGDWKTKLGSILLGIGGILESLPPLFPEQDVIAKLFLSIGGMLAGVGVADKFNKLTEAAKPK